jgi:hypothetical protein
VLRVLGLAASIGAALVGGLYAAARADLPHPGAPEPIVVAVVESAPEPAALDRPEVEAADALPLGIEVPEEDAALVDLYAEEILDEETGLRFGLVPASEPFELPVPPAVRRATRPVAPPVPVVRLSADPGRHVVLTARAMMSRNETVRGSCYRYVSTVFERAGHDGWRTRAIVHSARREGPYASLDLIRPGDWLYIVNHPERTPVGTHSVIFVGWEDRASGEAHVIEHPGGGSDMAGQERGYDVSRTYRIVRPSLPR